MSHLGLDISTTCTGWAVTTLDQAGKPTSVELGKIELDDHTDLLMKAEVVKSALLDISKRYKLSRIYIEENLQSFSSGASSAQTLFKLAKFNGIVTYLAYQITGVNPVPINVNHARKVLGICLKREKVCGVTTKDQIYNWVSSHEILRGYKWPVKIIGSGPRKGQTVLEKYVYDMSDAFVIVMSGPAISV
jgi:Holliday junction resolvasome RuvABC endonuclease subunit